MKGPLRALMTLALAGAVAMLAVKARERRRALSAGPLDSDSGFDERNMGDVATGEGMPEEA